jgi:hypothetical protein
VSNFYDYDKEHNPIPCDMETWANKFGDMSYRKVAQDEVGGTTISTVFLGLDHGFGEGPPILWETCIFFSEGSDVIERYTSYEDAVEGHQKVVEMMKTKGD